MFRCLLLLVALLGQGIPGRDGATLRGQVSEKDTGAPMPGAFVALRPIPGGAAIQVLADDRGRFELANVPPGPYELIASAGEHRRTHVATPYRRTNAKGRAELLILPGDVINDISIALPRAYAISGRVVDDSGVPLANVQMELHIVGTDSRAATGRLQHTDDRGLFRMYGVESGRYALCANPQLGPSFGATSRTTYARTCYPGAADHRAADEVVVDGADIMGLEVRLRRQSTFRITGTILTSTGALAPMAAVTLDGGEPGRSFGMSAQVGGGTFVLGRVTSGTYQLSARLGGFARVGESKSDDVEWGATPVEVATADVDGVVLQLKKGVSLRGRVVFEDPPAVSAAGGIHVRAQGFGISTGMRPESPSAAVEDNGTFALEGLFGPRVLRAQTPRGYVVKGVTYRGRDITDVPVEFDGDSGHQAVVVLTNRTGEVAGAITDQQGKPASGAWVFHFPADPARWQGFGEGLRQWVTTGRYRIPDLAAGDYYVIALAHRVSPSRPAEYEQLATLAERVTLLEHDRRAVDLRLVTWPPRR